VNLRPQVVVSIIVFALWFLCILLVQADLIFSSLMKRRWALLMGWQRLDVLAICPRFTFFSKLPTVHHSLLIRDRYLGSADKLTPWLLVHLPKRRIWRIVWNPQRRVRFALEDAAQALMRHSMQQIDKADTFSCECFAHSYLQHYCAQLPSFPGTVERQYMLAQSSNLNSSAKPEALFLSPFFLVHGGFTRNFEQGE